MAKILVVDDDTLVTSLVQRKLCEAGYTVHLADNGQKALETINREHVDLVITDVMMPVLDGWAFIRELRILPECAFLPVLFLTSLNSADDRIKGFRLGADDYLAKPFKPEELLMRVDRCLRNGQRLQSVAHSSVDELIGFEGTLDQVGFSSLLVLLEMERKSGELTIMRKDESGVLLLNGGRVVSSSVRGGDVPQSAERGVESIYHMLRWCDGRFNFKPREVTAEDEIRSSTTALLMEGARRMDEGSR